MNYTKKYLLKVAAFSAVLVTSFILIIPETIHAQTVTEETKDNNNGNSVSETKVVSENENKTQNSTKNNLFNNTNNEIKQNDYTEINNGLVNNSSKKSSIKIDGNTETISPSSSREDEEKQILVNVPNENKENKTEENQKDKNDSKDSKTLGDSSLYIDKNGTTISNNYTGWATTKTNKTDKYWFDNGEMAAGKEAYDSESNAWYWFDANGIMARNKDVYLAEYDKWVRYDNEGHMIKGEDFLYNGWYYFDTITGAMTKGFVFVTYDNSDQNKWVYYDEITGQMHHGESCIHNNWYRFDDCTGKMVHGEYLSENNWYYYDAVDGTMQKGFVALSDGTDEGKWVFYDRCTGVMVKGEAFIDDNWYRFDEITGKMVHGDYSNDEGDYYYDPITGIMHKGLVWRDDVFYKYDDITGVFIRTAPECVPYDGRYREITCWGDSMTQGVGSRGGTIYTENGTIDIGGSTYPNVIQSKTGITTFNMGVGGENSEEIMKREEDFYNTEDRDDIVILEIGSNGGWHNDYDELVQQYWDMINTAHTSYYIIVGDTDDPGTSIGDRNQGETSGQQETRWETALREAFGEHFFNTRLYMINNGLRDCNWTADDDDKADQEAGRIPKKLRSDWTHFNAYGYYSKGLGILEKGHELGYW